MRLEPNKVNAVHSCTRVHLPPRPSKESLGRHNRLRHSWRANHWAKWAWPTCCRGVGKTFPRSEAKKLSEPHGRERQQALQQREEAARAAWDPARAARATGYCWRCCGHGRHEQGSAEKSAEKSQGGSQGGAATGCCWRCWRCCGHGRHEQGSAEESPEKSQGGSQGGAARTTAGRRSGRCGEQTMREMCARGGSLDTMPGRRDKGMVDGVWTMLEDQGNRQRGGGRRRQQPTLQIRRAVEEPKMTDSDCCSSSSRPGPRVINSLIIIHPFRPPMPCRSRYPLAILKLHSEAYAVILTTPPVPTPIVHVPFPHHYCLIHSSIIHSSKEL